MKKKFTFITDKKMLLVTSAFFLTTNISFSQGSCASPDGAFFVTTGNSASYAVANSSGWCYNNLNAGQTYCWTYTYPATGDFFIKIIRNSTCGNCDGSASICLSPGCVSGPFSFTISCANTQYTPACAIQQVGGIEIGTSSTPAQVCGNTFTWCITIPAGCGTMDVCPMVSSSCIAILPVELLSFTGKNECEKNILSWTSATETNNDYYTIERSTDGTTFSTAAIVEGVGNSNVPVTYEFIDQQEILDAKSAAFYYRLKQTDFDGKSEVFDIIALEKDCGNKIIISPTLTDGVVLVRSGNNHSGKIISVFDSMGRKIISASVAKDETDTKIDLSNYSKGLYTVVVVSTKETIAQKVVLK